MSPLLADHGSIVSAIPFVVPMLVVAGGLIVLILRDRLSGGHGG
jgi:hypothetical protein